MSPGWDQPPEPASASIPAPAGRGPGRAGGEGCRNLITMVVGGDKGLAPGNPRTALVTSGSQGWQQLRGAGLGSEGWEWAQAWLWQRGTMVSLSSRERVPAAWAGSGAPAPLPSKQPVLKRCGRARAEGSCSAQTPPGGFCVLLTGPHSLKLRGTFTGA